MRELWFKCTKKDGQVVEVVLQGRRRNLEPRDYIRLTREEIQWLHDTTKKILEHRD
ncbi:MAG TPA: hypothetical protein V6D22_16975 [Candidatus Obscuribacterales bacterium]